MIGMFPRKPKLDARTREDVDLYSTDDLRRLYQSQEGKLVRLRDSVPTREELKAEIHWRLWCESWRVWVTLWVALVGALAAIVAAVEGWPHAK